MRISRIDSLGGNCPPLNPSTKMEPPLGPADGPANACRSAARSSGSSESASRSDPRSTTALALLEESVLKTDAESSTVTFSDTDATLRVRVRVCGPACNVILTAWAWISCGAVAWTEYSPGGTPSNEYVPLGSATDVRAGSAELLKVTLAAGTRAPLSSVTCPRNVAVCANRLGARIDSSKKQQRRVRLIMKQACIPPGLTLYRNPEKTLNDGCAH